MSRFLSTGIRRWATALSQRFARVNPRPILIAGNQKSGTSAIAALAAARAGVDATIDIPGFWPRQHDIYRGQVPLRDVIRANRRDFSRAIVKEPGLTFVAEQLRACFPDAPIVLVVRDPRDNIRSILDRLGMDGRITENPPADQLPPGWTEAFDQRSLGIDHPHPIGRAALRWRLAAEVGLEEGVTVVRYEDFVTDKTGTIDRLLSHVGLSPENDIADLLDRRFQPRGAHRDADPERFFGTTNLMLIEELCADAMDRYHYPLRMRTP